MWTFASPVLLELRTILGRPFLVLSHNWTTPAPPISVPSYGSGESGLEVWGWHALSSSFAPWAKSCSCHHCFSHQPALEGLAVLKSVSSAWNKWRSSFRSFHIPNAMPCSASALWAFGISLSVFLLLVFLRLAGIYLYCPLPMYLCPHPRPWWHFISGFSRCFFSWIFPHTLLSLECFLILLSGVISKSLPL